MTDPTSNNPPVLLCSGAPFDPANDPLLARRIGQWPGPKAICGGTTAAIVARELERELHVRLERDPSGLPPTSNIEGIDLVTEGVITLARVRERMAVEDSFEGSGTDYTLIRLLLAAPAVHILVGQAVNPAHSGLPIEKRTTLIRSIENLLVQKFGKSVTVEFL